MPKLMARLGPDPTRILRFGLVGLLTAAIYFGVLLLLVERLGFVPGWAAAVAYVAAIAVNFFGQKLFTFRNRAGLGAATWRYAVLLVALMAANTTGMMILPGLAAMPYLDAQIVVCIVVTALSYLAQRFWIFRQP